MKKYTAVHCHIRIPSLANVNEKAKQKARITGFVVMVHRLKCNCITGVHGNFVLQHTVSHLVQDESQVRAAFSRLPRKAEEHYSTVGINSILVASKKRSMERCTSPHC